MEFCKKVWLSEDEEFDQEEIIGLPQAVDFIEDTDLEEALSSSKTRKTAGAENINVDVYKYLPAQAKHRLLDTVNQCWRQIVNHQTGERLGKGSQYF